MTREELSAFSEEVHNGEAINWDYWACLSNITPAQAARLAFHIDPITWPDMGYYKPGVLPDDLRDKIARFELWLANHSSSWSLADLVTALGEDYAPFGMVQQCIVINKRGNLNASDDGMNYFKEKEKMHYEHYDTDPEYRLVFDAKQADRVAKNDRRNTEREAQESKERNEAGRNTLEEAARYIANNSKAIFDNIYTDLKESAIYRDLPVYLHNRDERHKKCILGWREEAYWDDLNEWLEQNEPRINYRFPNPNRLGEQSEARGIVNLGKKTAITKKSFAKDDGRPKERQEYFRPIWEGFEKPKQNFKIWNELKKRITDEGPIKDVFGNDTFTFIYQDGSSEQLERKTFQNDMTNIRNQK